MKRLTLVRHAEALDPPATSDRDRPLSEFGAAQARALGQWFQQHPEPVDLWWVSSALRARQTLDGIRALLGDRTRTGTPEDQVHVDQVHCEDAFYLAEPERILECLQRVEREARHVCVVGHNPGLSMLGGQLSRARAPSLGTGCLVTLSLDLENWSELRRCSATELDSFSP